MEGESQGLSYQSTSRSERVLERVARFQTNVEAARREIGDLYERYTGLGVPLTGEDFEEEVLRVVRGLGFVAERTKSTADGGIDIVARRAEPLLRGKYIIQCKNWGKPVGARVVRELYGVVMDEGASKGTLITTSRFTKPALEFAVAKPLELIDGDGWRELVLGMPATSAEAVRETSDDLMAYAMLGKWLAEKVRFSFDGLTHLARGMPHVEKRELEKGALYEGFSATIGQLDAYLSDWEAWVQDSVSTMKELVIARPPADSRELYRRIVGAFHDALVAVLGQLSAWRVEDGALTARVHLDLLAVYGPILEGLNELVGSYGPVIERLDQLVGSSTEKLGLDDWRRPQLAASKRSARSWWRRLLGL